MRSLDTNIHPEFPKNARRHIVTDGRVTNPIFLRRQEIPKLKDNFHLLINEV